MEDVCPDVTAFVHSKALALHSQRCSEQFHGLFESEKQLERNIHDGDGNTLVLLAFFASHVRLHYNISMQFLYDRIVEKTGYNTLIIYKSEVTFTFLTVRGIDDLLIPKVDTFQVYLISLT
jgi:hypothetical protein